ncbi:MAG: hypothetical protein Q9208_008668 [Pyrenodesmia sp. 3 TL-2023]
MQEYKKADDLAKEAPRFLSAVRKRSLTLPLPTVKRGLWQRKQNTADQVHSVFFGRFPLEIRELIYEYYLGTRAWEKDGNVFPSASSSLLPLLKTCRRTYSETIERLYTQRVFCFQDPLSLEFFVETVLPQRLSLISTVQLPWKKTLLGFLVPPHQFGEALEKLQDFRNMREVRIVDVGDQRWSKSWIYHNNNFLLNQVVQKTDANIVLDHRVVCDGPVWRPRPNSNSTFNMLIPNSDGIYVPRVA